MEEAVDGDGDRWYYRLKCPTQWLLSKMMLWIVEEGTMVLMCLVAEWWMDLR